jgi:hypothetical protein
MCTVPNIIIIIIIIIIPIFVNNLNKSKWRPLRHQGHPELGECWLSLGENRVLSKIFWPKRDKVTGEWKRLHNEELNKLYSSSNIIRVIKLRRMRWEGHVARIGERQGT